MKQVKKEKKVVVVNHLLANQRLRWSNKYQME